MSEFNEWLALLRFFSRSVACNSAGTIVSQLLLFWGLRGIQSWLFSRVANQSCETLRELLASLRRR